MAWCIIRADGYAAIVAPYSDAFIAELKRTVPGSCREWQPEGRAWLINPIYANDAMRLAWRIYGRISIAHEQHPRERLSDDELLDLVEERWPSFYTLGLLPVAEPEAIQGAYRGLARRFHPDAGGDLETMKRINNAFDAVSEVA